MPGTGYNIPISVSYARNETLNPIQTAYTVFNFSSPWGSGGTNDITSRQNSSATATSSAAEGGNAGSATQSATNPVETGGGSSVGGIPTTYLLAGAAAIVAAFAFLYFKRK